jgi:HNH endonuclease
MLVRKLSEAQKKLIAGAQSYKCANSPDKSLRGIENFKCPQWMKPGIYKGSFDESGYDIDHILEFSAGGTDDDDNLQALCKSCHSVKTKRFMVKHVGEVEYVIRDDNIKQLCDIDATTRIEDQLIAIDESVFNFNNLLKKKKCYRNIMERLAIKKHSFMQNWCVANVKPKALFKEFIYEYYTKDISRVESLFGYVEIKEFKKANEMIVDLLNRLIGEDNDEYCMLDLDDIEIDGITYKETIDDIANNSIYFSDEENNRKLFFDSKCKNDYGHICHHTAVIKSLLSAYCINLERTNRVRNNGKRYHNYKISIDKHIKYILDYKHGETNTMTKNKYFSKLFV